MPARRAHRSSARTCLAGWPFLIAVLLLGACVEIDSAAAPTALEHRSQGLATDALPEIGDGPAEVYAAEMVETLVRAEPDDEFACSTENRAERTRDETLAPVAEGLEVRARQTVSPGEIARATAERHPLAEREVATLVDPVATRELQELQRSYIEAGCATDVPADRGECEAHPYNARRNWSVTPDE